MAAADREKRYLVVVQSGDHVTLGRQTDPSEAEIAKSGSNSKTWERLDGSSFRRVDITEKARLLAKMFVR